MKPKIFVGSSTEALEIAYAIQENLEHDAICQVWTQGIFDLTGNALDNLLIATEHCSYAIFIFQPDDLTTIRNKNTAAVRDNVVFELGLFIGKLGKDRVFFLMPSGNTKMHLPTDLLGVTPGHYSPPSRGEDLLPALGPFCNKVRRQISRPAADANGIEGSIPDESLGELGKNNSNNDGINSEVNVTKELELGITVDQFGNHTISIEPTVFWDHRICRAFPGVRGIEWFNDPIISLDRLAILLEEPTSFERCVGHGVAPYPIWWWRGGRSMHISNFNRLSDTRCLLDYQELEITRIAVYQSPAYWQHFVYVETAADSPTGLYSDTDERIKRQIEMFGFAFEEYGLFQGQMITRECYDDGAAVFNGKVVDISGATQRTRFLSKYNFIIASHFSPINSKAFDKASEPLLNDMLSGSDKLSDICSLVRSLPRHDLDD